ncbi:MAG: hypothetical protein IJQ21_05900 [Lachnospiraceae bacterium]|nr:hypothetical protein [Lachnospiraceae bacterium]
MIPEEERVEEAEQFYQEWDETPSDNEDIQEEKQYLRDWKMWVSRIILVVFIASLLFSFLSHYIRF